MTTTATRTLHPTRHPLPQEARQAVIEGLNTALATVLDLRTQVKQAHWNVKGMQFFPLHNLFDEMAGELEAYVDDLAERATTLGGTALGTIRMAAQNSRLSDYPADITRGEDHVRTLADAYAIVSKLLLESIELAEQHNDADTADLFTGISRDVDLRLWFLEAHLQA